MVSAGEKSRLFTPKQGIHQGDVWSMPLYCVYNNDLIKELKTCMYSTHIAAINITCPTFVDDLTLLAWSREALNRLLCIANRYSKKWRFMFGADKSFVLIFGDDTGPKQKLVLGSSEVTVTDTHIHVGVPLCSSEKAEKKAINQRVSSCRQTFFTIKALTTASVLMNPIVGSKLYWSLCVSKLTYGLEVWPPGEKGLSAMESVHNEVAKHIQGLPNTTSNPVCHATLNWRTVESHYAISTLMFLWNLLSLPTSCIYNTLLAIRLYNSRYATGDRLCNANSPIHVMYNIAVKYGLAQCVFDMLESGQICARGQWRSIVNKAVRSTQAAKWLLFCMMYKRINRLYFPEPTLLDWWVACKGKPFLIKKCRVLILLVIGEHNLGCAKGRHIWRTRLCQLCDSGAEETVPHFLLECSGLLEIRATLLSDVLREMPQGMVDSFNVMNYSNKAQFMLCEMGRSKVPEWESILVNIIELVYGLYRARNNILQAY